MRARFESKVEELGRGVSATVYLAKRRADGRDYAIKVFNTSDATGEERRHMMKEATLLAALSGHPHIVRFKEAFVSVDSSICVVMEPLKGGSMGQFIRNRQRRGAFLPEASVWRLFLQAASAVGYLHANNVCHRDLKPCNIMFENPNSGWLKLVDFGLSKHMRASQLTNTMVGTPMYLAPEVFAWKPYGYSCDSWSLGCILYELAALQYAFEAPSTRALRFKMMSGHTEPLPAWYSRELRDTVALLLQPDPAQRITVLQLLQLPWVAARLTELQQQGLVGVHAEDAGAPTLTQALKHLESEESEAVPTYVRSLSMEITRLMDVLPPPRYSIEASSPTPQSPPASGADVPQGVRLALSSAFYASSVEPAQPGSPGPSTELDSCSPQAAALAALQQPSTIPCQPGRPAAAARGAARTPAVRSPRHAPLPTDSEIANLLAVSPPPGSLMAKARKIFPRFLAMVAAADAELARRASQPGTPATPATPVTATAIAASQPTTPATPVPAADDDHACRSSRSGMAAGAAADGSGSSRSGTAAAAAPRPRAATPRQTNAAAEKLRAAVAASIAAQEEAILRHMLQRVAEVAARQAQRTPRTPQYDRARPRSAAPTPTSRCIIPGRFRAESDEVRLSLPSAPALLEPSVVQAEVAAAADERAQQAAPAVTWPAEVCAATDAAAEASGASASSGKAPKRRRWWLLRVMERRRTSQCR